MELKDYTDDELRGELKRRSIERRKAAKAEIKKETYVYTEAVVNQYTRVYHEKILTLASILKMAHWM